LVRVLAWLDIVSRPRETRGGDAPLLLASTTQADRVPAGVPRSRGSTSLSATLLKLHRTDAFSAVLAANRKAANDLLHPAVGEVEGCVQRAPDAGIPRVLVLATPRLRKRGGCEGARRAAHELDGGVAAEAPDVREPDERLDATG
jgi:hypothetical protein